MLHDYLQLVAMQFKTDKVQCNYFTFLSLHMQVFFYAYKISYSKNPKQQNGEDHLEIVQALAHNFRLNEGASEQTLMYSFQTGYSIADISLQFYNLEKKNIYLLSGPRKSFYKSTMGLKIACSPLLTEQHS